MIHTLGANEIKELPLVVEAPASPVFTVEKGFCFIKMRDDSYVGCQWDQRASPGQAHL